jgi:RimJ/RimL family protein N-acetyltransferase
MLRLRPYRESDAKAIVTWIRSEQSFYQWSAGRLGEYPLKAENFSDYLRTYAGGEDFYQMTAFDEEGQAGHLFMRFLDEEKTSLRLGFIILDDSRRGKGYGREMLLLALQYAFEILRAQKVSLGVFENNPSAYRCYQAVGFSDTGRYEMFSFMGEDWKCLELECSKEDRY